MNSIRGIDRRFVAALMVIAMVLVAGLFVVVSSNASNDPVPPGTPDTTSAASPPASSPEPSSTPTPSSEVPAQDLTASQVAFHDSMRKLWEDHATWTRLAIVNFAAGAPGYEASANRLLENQQDIGDAIKPYYGEDAGTQLTVLLNDHIITMGEIMQAVRDGNGSALQTATAEWYTNGEQIADHLAAANPDNWSQEELRAMMKTHLDQTYTEAIAELRGEYDASVDTYEDVHNHILVMADTLSSGIIAQFSDKFEN